MAAAAPWSLFFWFLFLFGGRTKGSGFPRSDGLESWQDSLASIFLAGDRANRLERGNDRGSEKEFGDGWLEGATGVVAGQAPFCCGGEAEEVIRGNGGAGLRRSLGRKAFGLGLEGHSSGE